MNLAKFSSVSVAVLGDVILDEYVYGRVSRISPEAPVPVLEVESRTQSLGGAGNVARNIASLGGKASLFSVIGSDEPGRRTKILALSHGISINGTVADDSRPTTVKQRVAALTQQIVRIDSEVVAPISENITESLGVSLEMAAQRFDALVISDYDKGVISTALLYRAITAFASANKPIVVDPNVMHFFRYGQATVVTPNHLQLERVSGKRIRTESELLETAVTIRERLGSAALLVTRGESGMALIDDSGIVKIPTVAREVYDVTGAGDTVVAVMALGLASGLSILAAARIANAAAGIVVGKRGTAVVSIDELSSRLADLGDKDQGVTRGVRRATDHSRAILSTDQLERRHGAGHSGGDAVVDDTLHAELSVLRASNKKIVFTNGCFDVLHAGHIRVLTEAKEQGDFLVVGLNSDASVRRLKGSARPIHAAPERTAVLEAIRYVDRVIVFDDDTPMKLIQAIKPDVLVKGADYGSGEIVGEKEVLSWRGRVHRVPLVPGCSTTEILKHGTDEAAVKPIVSK